MRFRDRTDAGRRLGEQLRQLELHDPLVLALPRGGVPVGFEVALALDARLDVFVARKIGAPGHPEFGIGAIAEGDGVVVNARAVSALGLSPADVDRLAARERAELDRRVRQYRADRTLPSIEGRDVVLVDDGLATGVTAEAALHALRQLRPRRLVLAAPACARQTSERLADIADDVVCVMAPPDFRAVSQWYDHFDQTTDDEVTTLLERSVTSSRG